MFSNIGGKIKTMMTINCWLLIILSLIIGISMLISGAVLSGVIVLIAGPIAAWESTSVLYGFGELVENSCIQTNLMIKQDMEKK